MATLSNMGIPGGGSGILAPKLKNRWQITFSGLAQKLPNSGRDLTMQAISCTRPNLSFEEIQQHRYNSIAYVGGKHTWEPCSLTVEDDVTGLAAYAIQSQLETQQRLIGANPGEWLNAEATASGYKFGMSIQMLDGDSAVVEEWKLEGCWFQAVDYGDLDYSASEASTISITVRFDHARQILSGQGYGTSLGGNL